MRFFSIKTISINRVVQIHDAFCAIFLAASICPAFYFHWMTSLESGTQEIVKWTFVSVVLFIWQVFQAFQYRVLRNASNLRDDELMRVRQPLQMVAITIILATVVLPMVILGS